MDRPSNISDSHPSRRDFHQRLAAIAATGAWGANLELALASEAETPLRIWDLHGHFSGVTGKNVEERIDQVMLFADRMGVERQIFFMGYPWSSNPTPEQFHAENDQVIRAIGKWKDRSLGFAYLNPHHEKESLTEFDRCVKDGPLVGIKLWVAQRCNDESLDAIIARAGEQHAAIYQHTWYKNGGNQPGESTPEDLAQLAARHPDVPIICGHTGGDWERGIRAIRGQENVSIGIGGSDPTAGFVEMAVRELGSRRIIYGSDAGGRSYASQQAKVLGADVSTSAKRLILGGNLRRMLATVLKAKGIDAG